MAPLDRIWLSITQVLQFFSFSPFDSDLPDQVAILPSPPAASYSPSPDYPHFRPPGHAPSGPDANFHCEYPRMKGWRHCSTPEDLSCWLKNDATGEEIGINTNYEETDSIPFGIHRTYYLNITQNEVNADGMLFKEGKLFNSTYPGPWIQGCWGDVRCYPTPHDTCKRANFIRTLPS
jgi:hypothetical protein